MKQGGTVLKTCEKHDHSAMPQLSFSVLNFPILEIFPHAIGIQVSSLLIVFGVDFL